MAYRWAGHVELSRKSNIPGIFLSESFYGKGNVGYLEIDGKIN
jgi:hypothetical protein